MQPFSPQPISILSTGPEVRPAKAGRGLTRLLSGLAALALSAAFPSDVLAQSGASGAQARTTQTIKREPIRMPVTSAGCQAARAPGKPYFVEFRSRTAASYGHTFVFYGRLGSGNRFATFKVAGLHPKGDDPAVYMRGHMVPVPSETGVSYGDMDEQYLTARFCVTLTAAEYQKVEAAIRNLQRTKTTWHAPTYNCNSFAADIARAAGLDSPNPNMYLPQAFINRMADLNGGSRRTAQSTR